jgi:hypothetical protein
MRLAKHDGYSINYGIMIEVITLELPVSEKSCDDGYNLKIYDKYFFTELPPAWSLMRW